MGLRLSATTTVTAFRPRPSGNTPPAVGSPARDFRGGIRSAIPRPTTEATAAIHMMSVRQAGITPLGVTAFILIHPLWAVLRPTVTDYTTCQALSGIGAMTGMTVAITIVAHNKTHKVQYMESPAFSAAAVGTPVRSTAVRQSAPRTPRPLASATTGFVLP